MKTRILMSLCVALAANCVSVRADDTPAQAAARAALDQELRQLNRLDAGTSNANSATSPTRSAEPMANGPATPAQKPSVPVPEAAPASAAPAEDTSAQAVALTALKRKMDELNRAIIEPPQETNSAAALPTAPTAASVQEASVAATPVIETPAGEAPVARTPAIAAAAVGPVSAAPAVVAPVPKVSTAPVVAAPSAAVTPAAIPRPLAPPIPAPVTSSRAGPLLPSSSSGTARPTNELVTTAGQVYRNVEVERVANDGIVISYAPVQGGWAMTKVPFRELPPVIRQQYESLR